MDCLTETRLPGRREKPCSGAFEFRDDLDVTVATYWKHTSCIEPLYGWMVGKGWENRSGHWIFSFGPDKFSAEGRVKKDYMGREIL